jgi:hypothetical protein
MQFIIKRALLAPIISVFLYMLTSCGAGYNRPYSIKRTCLEVGKPYTVKGLHCSEIGCPICTRWPCVRYRYDTIWGKSHPAPGPLKSKGQ